jgi:hypothetical protein
MLLSFCFDWSRIYGRCLFFSFDLVILFLHKYSIRQVKNCESIVTGKQQLMGILAALSVLLQAIITAGGTISGHTAKFK